MRLRQITVLIILFFVSAYYSFGSNKLHPGYLITLNNDTLHGFININNRKITPDIILFKETTVGAGQHYTPKSILEFRAGSKIYRSAIVKTDPGSNDKRKLSSSPNFSYIIDTVFLQAIVLGEKELYTLKDSSGKENFFIKQDSNYVWLMYKKYLSNNSDNHVITTNSYYIAQLIRYLKNCRTINPILSEATYTYKSLLKSFLYYYGCTGTKIEYREDEESMNSIEKFFAK